MRLLKQTARALFVFLAANAVGAGTNGFQRQLITLPLNAIASRFADVNSDGRTELLAVDPMERKLLIYRQRASGFTNVPDQVIALPPRTAWIAPCDVEAHPGLELLMSTATGLVYHRQDGGVFESELRTLIKADQVFTNDDSPSLISLPTNGAIPVISATQAVLYQRNDAFAWSPGPTLALEAKRTSWFANCNDWSMGSHPARSMRIQQSLRANPSEADDEKPENDPIRKLIEDMKEAGSPPGLQRVDVDGDGRKDLVLWQTLGEMDFRTDVYVYLRGADDRLPERPTQILHCRGVPLPVGSTREVSPIADLKGDGRHELILLELKTRITSASSLVEMALSRGVELAITIRSFHQGTFSRSHDAAIPITAMMSLDTLEEWSMFICGDFNGDGRPDLVVQRSPTQWNILFSTGDERWFIPQPAMTFETPMQGYFEINDLNGDGRSDMVLRAWDDPRVYIFLSPSPRTKGNR